MNAAEAERLTKRESLRLLKVFEKIHGIAFVLVTGIVSPEGEADIQVATNMRHQDQQMQLLEQALLTLATQSNRELLHPPPEPKGKD